MKKIAFLLLSIALLTLSCEKKDEKKGDLQFTLDINGSSLKTGDKSPTALLISIVKSDGTVVYNSEKIELINFSGNYMSKPIALEPGKYKLTKFMVLDASNNAIYATPKEGSDLAYLVSDPLDIDINIQSDALTNIVPEVLSTSNAQPKSFGYLDASFKVVNTLEFLVTVFVYNANTKSFELTDAQASVLNNGKVLYNFQLSNKTNKLTIGDNYSNYTILVKKAGYNDYSKDFTKDELTACFDYPLIITLNQENSLVAYYPFNGNAIDESGNGNNGIVNGAQLTTDRFGNEKSAYYFDGNLAYINIGNNSVIKRYKEDFTISGWMKLNEYSSSYHSIILSNRNINTPNISGSFLGVGGYPSSLAKKFEFLKSATVTSDTYTYDYLGTKSDVKLNEWVFFCVTYQYVEFSNVVKLYINGVLESQKTIGETIDPLDGHTYIGCEPALKPLEYSFKGSMDEIKIYNKVLSDQEIVTLYLQ